ncbi:MAG: HIT family protein [Patescibacteria group bacterium]
MNQTILAFGYPKTLLKEYTYWVVMLRPQQITIGSLIVAAKSDVTKLGDLEKEAWLEFSGVAREMEELLTRVFDAEKFNYLALMMKDPNPHFHFVPRYSKPVVFNGKEYIDADWPLKTELRALDLSSDEFLLIMNALKKA